MAFDTIPIHFLCESSICYICIPDANAQEITIVRILTIQYSYSIRAVVLLDYTSDVEYIMK